jgi:hypothetical protein
MEGNNTGSDGWIFFNAPSIVVDTVTVYGTSPPIPGVYRGALLDFGLMFQAPAANPALHFSLNAVVNNAAITATDNITVAVKIDGSLMKQNMNVQINNLAVRNGLVGVYFTNNSANTLITNAIVSNANAGFYFSNRSHANIVRDSVASQCCQAYYADATTFLNNLYGDTAMLSQTSYTNLGTNNLWNIGTNARDNVNSGEGMGAACTLVNPTFDPFHTQAMRRRDDSDYPDHVMAAYDSLMAYGKLPLDGSMNPQQVYDMAQCRIAQRLSGRHDLSCAEILAGAA